MESSQAAAVLAPNINIIGVWVAAILTLMVYSHLLKDNPLSRLAEYLFVGVAAGYALVLACHNVLWPKLIQPLLTDPEANYVLFIPATLSLLLLLRPIGPLRVLASLPLAVVIGVGAALAVAGAAAGSLLPQAAATMLSLDAAQPVQTLVNNLLIVVCVLSTILYFFFTAKEKSVAGRLLRVPSFIGKWTLILTFGILFAATITSRLALLVGRLQFLFGDWLGLIK